MSRSSIQIKVGSYAGNSTDNTDITGVGFRPKIIIVKGGANVACIRTQQMPKNYSVSMSSSLALALNQVKGAIDDGFRVGTSSLVNASGTTYYYIAISFSDAQSYLRLVNYLGNGSDDRNKTFSDVNFTPNLAMVFGDTAQTKAWRSSDMVGDLSQFFGGVAGATNRFQNLQSGGFQLGTSSEVNGNLINYYGLVAKILSGAIAVGTYTGNGVDNRNITGVGFDPSAVMVKRDGTSQGRLMTSDMASDLSAFMGAAGAAANGIQSLITDGFQVGNDNSVNGNGITYYWWALKQGSFLVPISRSVI